MEERRGEGGTRNGPREPEEGETRRKEEERVGKGGNEEAMDRWQMVKLYSRIRVSD